MASPALSSATVGEDEVELGFPEFFLLYKSGRFVRCAGTDRVPASLDKVTGVDSKDVIIDQDTGLTVRLFLPPVGADQKLPVVLYYHGGFFCMESALSPIYHRHVSTLSSLGPLIAVSVDYRLAPEHPLPAAYEDSWAGLRWVLSLADPWLADHADLNRVFLAGDSAGANIAHNLALRARENADLGVSIKGIALIHPYFWGSAPIGSESADLALRAHFDKIWRFLCPDTTGSDDPRVNPIADGAPSLALLGCERVLVTTAEKDLIKYRAKAYYEKLKESGWDDKAELVETPDAEHVFHLFRPDSEEAKEKVQLLVHFFNNK